MVHTVAVAVEYKVLDKVSGFLVVVFLHDEKRVKEIGVVLIMINDFMVGSVISLAKSGEAIAVVSVPIPKVLDIWVFFFNLSENPFLIFAILKETDSGSLRLRSRPYNSQ